MLKACWDCFSGNNGVQSDNELYPTQLNGDSTRAPPWPEQREDENMFVLPRRLNFNDRVNISGTITDSPRILQLNLIGGGSSPDYQNIAFQFEARFPSSGEDKIIISVTKNGDREIIMGENDDDGSLATDLFTGTNFSFSFMIRISNYNNKPIVDLYVENSSVKVFQLKHDLNEIRFISLNGDIQKVDKLDFEFS